MHEKNRPFTISPLILLKDVISSIGPCLLTIVNGSLVSGCGPSYFKQAVVQPLLEKPKLDPPLPSNYWLTSKLPLISKILEKVVANQLTVARNNHNIFGKFQSGFHQKDSTETAFLRGSNDITMSSEAGKCSILVLLELNAAFDTAVHCILIDRFGEWMGIFRECP